MARSRWAGSAAIRHAVWLGALCVCLLIPFIGAWVPGIHLPFPEIFPRAEVFSPDTSRPPVAALSTGRPDTYPDANEPAPDGSALTSSSAFYDVDWAGVAARIWLAGALLRLGWLVLLHSRTRRLTSRARSLRGHSRVEAIAEDSSRALGQFRTVPILTSAEVRMPLAWGVLRPVVLLPADALRWSDERLRVVLQHEIAHVRRHDYGTSLLSEAVCLLYWPTPLVWLARRRLRREQEHACDDRVLSLGTPALAYADHILATARDFYGSRWDLEVVVTMAREVSLKQRVRAILDEGTDRRPFRSAGGLALTALALIVYLSMGAVQWATGETAGAPSVTTAIAEVPSVAAPADDRPIYLWVEAESGLARESAYPGGDLDASYAQYVLLDPRTSRTAELGIGTTLEAAGEYFVWARVAADGKRSWTLQLAIGGDANTWKGAAEVDDDGAHDGWRWLRINARETSAEGLSGGVLLSAGPHLLEFSSTVDEVRVDRILVTNDPAYSPRAKGPVSAAPRAYLLIEGESGVRKGRIRTGDDPHASGTSFVVFRERQGASADGAVEFDFELPAAGRYLIWGRTFAKDVESNSFHVSLDGDAEVTWDIAANERQTGERLWKWDPVSARGARDMDPLPFDLAAGSHTLRIRTREGGAHLDALLITNDLDRRPDGVWPEALPARPLQVELSPERARLQGPINVSRDIDGQSYLVVADSGRADAPGRSGLAAFEFEAAEPGLYSIWARTVAPSADQDSFWIRVNGGDWVLWNGIPQSSEWRWAAVRDADAEGRLLQLRLEAGSHSVEIAGREGGLRLDRLLVTNDPLFHPS